MSYVVSVKPTVEPVVLSEAKSHMNIDALFTDDDTLITSLIVVAREFVEDYIRRALMTQTLVARHNGFPNCIKLERPNVKSVTSVQYIDTAGDLQTLATSVYDVDLYSTPNRITLAYGQTWPSTQTGVPNTVVITYVTGETTSANVPPTIRHAILMLIGHLYENREATSTLTIKDIPFSIVALLQHYKVY